MPDLDGLFQLADDAVAIGMQLSAPKAGGSGLQIIGIIKFGLGPQPVPGWRQVQGGGHRRGGRVRVPPLRACRQARGRAEAGRRALHPRVLVAQHDGAGLRGKRRG